MKKFFACIVIIAVLIPSCFAFADNRNVIVHRTATGYCYHRAGCSYLKSDYEITLEDAVKRGLSPCSRCNPPALDIDIFAAPDPQSKTVKDVNVPAVPAAIGSAAIGLIGYKIGKSKRK